MAIFPLFAIPVGGVLSATLVSRGRVVATSIFGIVSALVINVGVIIPAVIWHSPGPAVWGKVIAAIVMYTVGLCLILKYTPRGSIIPKWSSLKEMLSFAVPLGLATIVGTLSIVFLVTSGTREYFKPSEE